MGLAPCISVPGHTLRDSTEENLLKEGPTVLWYTTAPQGQPLWIVDVQS